MMTTLKKISLIALCFYAALMGEVPATVLVTSGLGAGFFAELNKVAVAILATSFSDRSSKYIEVDWSQEFFPYKEGIFENGWNLFFEPIGYVENICNINAIDLMHDQTCLNKWMHYADFYNYRIGMNALLNKYIKIASPILAEAETFFQSNMKGNICIGIHVRFSAAHQSEKPGVVTLNDYFKELDRIIRRAKKNYKIYLATDSQYVVNEFKKRYKNLLFSSAIRSNYKEEIHLIFDNTEYWLTHPQEFHAKKPGYKVGKDVLIDCLLLSKCQYLIHSTSNVSDYATFFTPGIKSIYLPKNVQGKAMDCAACRVKDKWYEN